MLDRKGLLRQSNHESRQKKILKKLEDDDFYASDEDEFLDRTGSIEQKRRNRMRLAGKAEKQKAETFESLTEKKEGIEKELMGAEEELRVAQETLRAGEGGKDDDDDLDSYMANLKSSGGNFDKGAISKLRLKVSELRKESQRLEKLINIARPTPLPELKSQQKATSDNRRLPGIMVGKRRGGFGQMRTISAKDKTLVRVPQVRDPSTILAGESEGGGGGGSNIGKADRAATSGVAAVVVADKDGGNETKEEEEGESASAPQSKEASMKGPQISEAVREVLLREAEADGRTTTTATPETSTTTCTSGDGETSAAVVGGARKRSRGRKRRIRDDDNPDADDETPLGGDYNTADTEKFAVWMPPEGQTGDGRTRLNDKLGY